MSPATSTSSVPRHLAEAARPLCSAFHPIMNTIYWMRGHTFPDFRRFSSRDPDRNPQMRRKFCPGTKMARSFLLRDRTIAICLRFFQGVKHTMRIRTSAMLLALWLALVGIASAQQTTGTLAGKLVDSQGLAV